MNPFFGIAFALFHAAVGVDRTMIRQSGFTLIELMVVMAILAVLAALGLQAYMDYVTRAQVGEGVSLAAGVRTALTEYGAVHDAWPAAIVGPATTAAATEINGTLVGRFAQLSGAVSGTYPSGTLLVTMNSGRAATGTVLFVTSDGGLTWSCTTGSVASRHRPQPCR